MPASLLKSFTNLVVDQAMEYAGLLTADTPACVNRPLDHKRIAVDLTLIIDGSRTAYENLQFIHTISEMVDVGTFGSYISVINGATGRFIVNRTNSISDMFDQLRNSTDSKFKSSFMKDLKSVKTHLIFRPNSFITVKFIRQFNVPARQSNDA